MRANADIPRDAKVARQFGAEGIGLCRTEHMFFAEDRLPYMQAMILATDEASRREALKKLLPMQKSDFLGLFEAMEGYPVTVRFLDPPLHEFLPKRGRANGGNRPDWLPLLPLHQLPPGVHELHGQRRDLVPAQPHPGHPGPEQWPVLPQRGFPGAGISGSTIWTAVRIADITDGTSNTIAHGEHAVGLLTDVRSDRQWTGLGLRLVW